MSKISLDGQSLTLEMVHHVMHSEKVDVSLGSEALAAMVRSRQRVEDILTDAKAVYGINTGFGALATAAVAQKDLVRLQENLIRSHAVGVGQPLPDPIVRGMLLIRANSLCKGFSGVRPVVVETLLSALNSGVTPYVPEIGSLGASGDLAPLSHMVLGLMGEGLLRLNGEFRPANEVLKACNIVPLSLRAKEGLGLINGTTLMSSLGVEASRRARNLCLSADVISALTLEALLGSASPFTEMIHKLRPHKGQMTSARRMAKLLHGSKNLQSHENCTKVQDAYSLRCIPQVHGASLDACDSAENVLEIEINSVTDNPLVLESGIVSGGNFHGQPIGLVLCLLAVAASELGSISERRQNRLMNPVLSDLPAFLTEASGLNSGLMILQYTSAALLTENRVLAHPAVLDSIPTSADQEDHVSMATTQARNTLKIVENSEMILAHELLMAIQGLRLLNKRRDLPLSPVLQPVYEFLCQELPQIDEDRVYQEDMAKATALVRSGSLTLADL